MHKSDVNDLMTNIMFDFQTEQKESHRWQNVNWLRYGSADWLQLLNDGFAVGTNWPEIGKSLIYLKVYTTSTFNNI